MHEPSDRRPGIVLGEATDRRTTAGALVRRLLARLSAEWEQPIHPGEERQGWGRWLAVSVILLAGNGASALSWRNGVPVNTGIYSTLLALGLYAWVGGIEWRRVGRHMVGWRPQWRRVRLALGAGLALAIPSILFFAVASLHGGVGYSPIPALSVQGLLIRELIEIPLLTALVEDLVFRQFLYCAFPRHTLGATLLTNAGIFTLWHLVVTARTVSGTTFANSLWLLAGSYLGSLATVFVAGIVLAYVRFRTGSFLYSALTHWLLVGLITLAVWVWR